MLPSAPSSWPQILESRYRPGRCLGLGGRSVVFEGLSTDGLPVAVKLPHSEKQTATPDTLRRILTVEATVLRDVAHPAIVRIIEAAPDGDFIVMERLHEHPLSSRWSAVCPGTATALKVGATLAHALERVHATGWLHLDVKPRNVLLRSPGSESPVLIDFGSARPVAKPLLADTIDAGRAGSGQYRYKAPEQLLRLTDHFGFETDAFGLGATLVWLLTGMTPFSNSRPSSREGLSAHEGELKAALTACQAAQVTSKLLDLLRDLLAFEMVARPGNMGEIARTLEEHVR